MLNLKNAKLIIPFETRQQLKHLYGGRSRKILKKIQDIEGSRIDPEIRKKCDVYAEEILGKRRYAEWLYVYALLSGEFKEGWIPDDYYGEVVVPKLKGPYGDISELNALQANLLGKTNLPDVAYCANGKILDTDYQQIQEVGQFLFANQKERKIIFKKDKSMQGRGIEIITPPLFGRIYPGPRRRCVSRLYLST